MKQYNCPDCEREDSCEGCPRTLNKNTNITIKHIPPYFPDSVIWPLNETDGIPNCCRPCSKHPRNGGDGICNCTAPLYDSSNTFRITCSTIDSNTYLID